MSDVLLENVYKKYGNIVAVGSVNLRLAAGEFVTLLGPSGCGKTTCLRMIAGFVTPTFGRIIMGGKDVTTTPPYRRNTGMVFQSYALFPHKTVAANVAFGMRVRGVSRAEAVNRTKEALKLVRLEGLSERYPSELSGGQRQRVALARAVVIRPDVLLLDEPLAALDLKLREELQVEIKRVQSTLKITTLFVTHDQGEALGMSDRVAVMRDGNIIQIDTPTALYRRPNCRFVANFVGRTNLIEVVVRERKGDNHYQVEGVDGATFEVVGQQHLAFACEESCFLAIRPEACSIGNDHRNQVQAKTVGAIYRGNAWTVDMDANCGSSFTVYTQMERTIPTAGEIVRVSWQPVSCFLLKRDEVP